MGVGTSDMGEAIGEPDMDAWVGISDFGAADGLTDNGVGVGQGDIGTGQVPNMGPGMRESAPLGDGMGDALGGLVAAAAADQANLESADIRAATHSTVNLAHHQCLL